VAVIHRAVGTAHHLLHQITHVDRGFGGAAIDVHALPASVVTVIVKIDVLAGRVVDLGGEVVSIPVDGLAIEIPKPGTVPHTLQTI
jgi:hypothetical protein